LSPSFDSAYYEVVDLERVVAGKISPGGTSPDRVAEQLAAVTDRLAALRALRPGTTAAGVS
jgi:argininosuccinate lyase